MNVRFSLFHRLSHTAGFAVFFLSLAAFGQDRPALTASFSNGQSILNITGNSGTIYSIQYADDFPAARYYFTNPWSDLTLVQIRNGSNVWSDPSVTTTGHRFYRAVSVAPPADTNLVFIQPGTFTMGSPANEDSRNPDESQHMVTISRGFWMGKYLVTQGDYLSVMGTNPSSFHGDSSLPVDSVTWFDATYYCALRTEHEQAAGLISTNYIYRLPTESEWEYAARAGTTTAFYLGNELLSGEANFYGPFEFDGKAGPIYNGAGIHLDATSPVGSFAPNEWGLYDMIGNAWELCQDWYAPYPTGPVTDPQGAVDGLGPVLRGGSWNEAAEWCRSAIRNITTPFGTHPSGFSNSSIGFRVVLAQGQPRAVQ